MRRSIGSPRAEIQNKQKFGDKKSLIFWYLLECNTAFTLVLHCLLILRLPVGQWGMCTGAKAQGLVLSISLYFCRYVYLCLVLFCSLVLSLNIVYIFWPFFYNVWNIRKKETGFT